MKYPLVNCFKKWLTLVLSGMLLYSVSPAWATRFGEVDIDVYQGQSRLFYETNILDFKVNGDRASENFRIRGAIKFNNVQPNQIVYILVYPLQVRLKRAQQHIDVQVYGTVDGCPVHPFRAVPVRLVGDTAVFDLVGDLDETSLKFVAAGSYHGSLNIRAGIAPFNFR